MRLVLNFEDGVFTETAAPEEDGDGRRFGFPRAWPMPTSSQPGESAEDPSWRGPVFEGSAITSRRWVEIVVRPPRERLRDGP